MSSGTLGVTLHNTEILDGTLPLFTSTNGAPSNWSLDPPNNAKSINFGVSVGLTKDFNGNTIFGNPDAGIIEYVNTVSSRPASLVAYASSAPINCFGESTTVSVTASGGALPYSGTGSFNVFAGTHQFPVSDAQGNKDTITITVSQPPLLTANLTAGSITTAGGSTSISVSPNGGTAPYTYALNGGLFQTNEVFNNITAGDYSVVTKDVNGCISQKNIIIAESTNNYYNPRFKVSIWPNPTTNYFKLQLSKIHGPYTVYITVYDANGHLVYSEKGDVYSLYTFGNNFSRGTYYVKVKVGTGIKSYAVLKL